VRSERPTRDGIVGATSAAPFGGGGSAYGSTGFAASFLTGGIEAFFGVAYGSTGAGSAYGTTGASFGAGAGAFFYGAATAVPAINSAIAMSFFDIQRTFASSPMSSS
jgi:hypothetical protein